jgi:GntR family transcriptional regulator/MocR family aminotransferase
LLQQGINVSALSIQYRHGSDQNGLVMGFAAADAQTTEKTMQKFRALLKAHFG